MALVKSSRYWGAWVVVEVYRRHNGGAAVMTTVCVQESTKWAWETDKFWSVRWE